MSVGVEAPESLVDCVELIRHALDAAIALPTWPLTDEQVRDLLIEVSGSTDQLAALTGRLALQAESSELPYRDGARTTTGWLAG